MNSDETFKGHGYVEFASAEAAEKVPLSMSCLLCKDKLNDSSPNLCSITYLHLRPHMHTHTSIYLWIFIRVMHIWVISLTLEVL